SADIHSPSIHLLDTGELDIKKDDVLAISNSTSGGASEEIGYRTVSSEGNSSTE
ncbi:hypothetical protein MKW92_040101, partial [Papaver armeniacum]